MCSDQHRAYLTRLCGVFRLSQPPDALLRSHPTRLVSCGIRSWVLGPSEVFPPVQPAKYASRRWRAPHVLTVSCSAWVRRCEHLHRSEDATTNRQHPVTSRRGARPGYPRMLASMRTTIPSRRDGRGMRRHAADLRLRPPKWPRPPKRSRRSRKRSCARRASALAFMNTATPTDPQPKLRERAPHSDSGWGAPKRAFREPGQTLNVRRRSGARLTLPLVARSLALHRSAKREA